MGIKGLNDVIKKYAKEILENEKSLSSLIYQKVAIDTTLYLYKYKAILGEKWMNGFINLILCLRKNNIHCVFIQDGKAPVEKSDERRKRAEQRDKLETKIFELENAINQYYQTDEVHKILLEISKDGEEKLKNLLGDDEIKDSVRVNIRCCENYLKKLKGQNVKISEEDFLLVQELFKYLGIPYFKSSNEAETMCCWLCQNGYVDAVLSEDTDVLAYKTKKFLTKINTANETCIQIDFNQLIDRLGLTPESFTDLCILCGNDYNDNMRGIGPDKSYKLIKEFKSIEEIEKITDLKSGLPKYDTSVLKYKRTRELFHVPENFKFTIPYCDKPDFNKLEEFLVQNNFRMNIEDIKKCFKAPELVINE